MISSFACHARSLHSNYRTIASIAAARLIVPPVVWGGRWSPTPSFVRVAAIVVAAPTSAAPASSTSASTATTTAVATAPPPAAMSTAQTGRAERLGVELALLGTAKAGGLALRTIRNVRRDGVEEVVLVVGTRVVIIVREVVVGLIELFEIALNVEVGIFVGLRACQKIMRIQQKKISDEFQYIYMTRFIQLP